MENYIVINGKKSELTKEQMKALGIEVKKNPFDVKDGENAYYINTEFNVRNSGIWAEGEVNTYCPCKDKSLVEKRAKQEQLSRLLWKFAHENDSVLTEKEMSSNSTQKWYIGKKSTYRYRPVCCSTALVGMQCFKTEEVCKRAIEEVIKPFISGEL